MKTFTVLLPNEQKRKIKYDTRTDRVKIANDIINEWLDYIDNNWIFYGKKDPNKLNPEEKIKMMLNALTAFIDDSSIVDKKSKDISLEYVDHSVSKQKTQYNPNNILLGIQKDQETYDFTNKRKIIKYKKSKIYRFNCIFTKKNISTQEISKLKNKDVFGEHQLLHMRKRLNLVEDEKYKKWLNKPAKNLEGQNIFTVVPKIIKGWEGIIDPSFPYISKWCYVNSIGEFEFNNKKFKIDIQKIPQYEDIRKDKYYKNESGWSMDNIYCIEQEGKIYFWDMNITKLNNEYITQI